MNPYFEITFALPVIVEENPEEVEGTYHSTLTTELLSKFGNFKKSFTHISFFDDTTKELYSEDCIEYAVSVTKESNISDLVNIIIDYGFKMRQKKVYVRDCNGHVRFIEILSNRPQQN